MHPRSAPICTSRRVSFASTVEALGSISWSGMSSARPRRSVFATWWCRLMKPGRTAHPEQSMTSSAVRSTSPTAAIRPSSTRISPVTRQRFSSWVTIRPPRSTKDMGGPPMGRFRRKGFRGYCHRESSNWKSIADTSRYAIVNIDFTKALQQCIDQVGCGRVATCGAIARALGDIRAARSVAVWVAAHPETPGSHRVVRADGRPVLTSASSELGREGTRLFRGRVSADRILDSLEPVGFLTSLREEQQMLSTRVVERGDDQQLECIAGVDASYDGDAMYVVATNLDAEKLIPVEISAVTTKAEFPYIPTFLAYREFPGIEAADLRLNRPPDLSRARARNGSRVNAPRISRTAEARRPDWPGDEKE